MTKKPPSEQVEMPQVALSGPGPSTLADLYSQARDLSFAAACMRECRKIAASNDQVVESATPVPQALFNAGLISYRRAFNSGRAHLMPKKSRFSLSDVLLQALSTEQRTVHYEMLKTANGHIAHRVGEGEDARVVALLAPAPQDREVVALGSLSLQFMGPTEEFASDAIALCEFALNVLQTGINQRTEALLDSLRETTDIDALYEQSSTPSAPPFNNQSS